MTNRLKILFTIPNFETAGSGKVVYDLVKGLDKSKFDPEICCFHDKGTYFEEIMKLGVRVHIFNFAVTYKPYVTLPFRILKIRQFFKKNQFDIIHSWHWSSDFTEPLSAKLAGIPFVYTKKAMGWGNKAWLWRSKLSTRIITINQDMVNQFFKNMLPKIDQIPLGVDTTYFYPQKKTFITPNGIKFDKEDFIIVSVANLAPVKGLEILIEAVEKMNDDSTKILIVGDDNNEYGQHLKKSYTKNLNLYFLGKHLDVRPYLALADVFIIPTKDEGRKEGMPIAPLEAMSSGKIVLGSNISGIKDILIKRHDLLFKPDNIEDLIRVISYIKKMTLNERMEIAKHLRSIVQEDFTIEKFIANHESLYIKLNN